MEEAMSGVLISSWVMLGIGVVCVTILLIVIVILILIACKFRPWRRCLSSSPAPRRYPTSIKDNDDIGRPLVQGDQVISDSQNNMSSSSNLDDQGSLSSTHFVSVASEPRIQPASPQFSHSDSFVLNIPNSSEDSMIGQTVKHPLGVSQFAGEQIHNKKEDINYSRKYGTEDKDVPKDIAPTANQGSTLMLQVISGPSCGLQHSLQSTNASKLRIIIGRVSPGDIILKDSEVSGKHAMISWNNNKLKWELVDMGSLNGTILNSRAIHLSQSGTRRWGNPVELSSGDIITVGTSSKILVHISAQRECNIPFGIGIASDPMAVRRGGKKLPMEDVCYYHWPLPGVYQFGLFGICDGHGGADAATSVSKIMPEVITGILSDSSRRAKVLSQCNASDVLKEAFYETEARISHYYEGCTATALLVWTDDHENCFMQCANVGDSACVVNIEGRQVKMTEDHRISSYSERLRMQALGTPLRDGETRICGINLARMLGDKFLKEQDARFSAEPYVSDVMRVDQSCKGFAIIASDGFWDVVSTRKAAQLVHQAMERNTLDRDKDNYAEKIAKTERNTLDRDKDNYAEKIAKALLNEARTLRTKDNTSIIFLDFTTPIIQPSSKLDHP